MFYFSQTPNGIFHINDQTQSITQKEKEKTKGGLNYNIHVIMMDLESTLLLLLFQIHDAKEATQTTSQSLEVASCMRSFLRILPDAFLGMESTNATRRILLYGATCYNGTMTKDYSMDELHKVGTIQWQVGYQL